MPEAVVKGLMIAGGVTLTCFVIGLLIYAGNQGSLLATAVVDNTANVTDRISTAELRQYDANVVYGSEVLNAVRYYAGNLTVTVSTIDSEGNVTDTSYLDTKQLDNIPYLADGSANAKYINPYAQFDSTLSTNANGVYSGIKFTQKKYLAVANTGPLVGDSSSLGGSGSGSGSGGAGGGTGVDYTTLQDVVNSQSAAIAELTTALESSNAGSASLIDSLKDQLAQLSTEQAELAEAMGNMTATMEDLQDLGVKIDSLEAQIGSLGTTVSGSKVFMKDGKFTFLAGQSYYITAIACGGAGKNATLTLSNQAASSGSGKTQWENTPYSYSFSAFKYISGVTFASGGSRGQYITRKQYLFAEDTQAEIQVGSNDNNGNTIIKFEDGQTLTLVKGGGGGGGTHTAPYTYTESCKVNAPTNPSGSYRGAGGASGFYTLDTKGISFTSGASYSTLSSAKATSVGPKAGVASTSLCNAQDGSGTTGGGGGYGFGAGGGGGGVDLSIAVVQVGTYPDWFYHSEYGQSFSYAYPYYARKDNGSIAHPGGLGAPGVVIIELQ